MILFPETVLVDRSLHWALAGISSSPANITHTLALYLMAIHIPGKVTCPNGSHSPEVNTGKHSRSSGPTAEAVEHHIFLNMSAKVEELWRASLKAQAVWDLPSYTMWCMSDTECFSRLYLLQGALAQQEWRVTELLTRLFVHLKPHLEHQYDNVRDRLGR